MTRPGLHAMRRVVRIGLGGLWIAWLVLAGGRSSGAQPPEPSDKAGQSVWLVSIVERNHDTFPRSLTQDREEASADRPAPFRLIDGRVVLHREAVALTDPAKLAVWNLRLGRPDAPLGRCRALVTYEIRYEGQGRRGAQMSYRAFPDLPAEIPVEKPPAVAGDAWEHDPAAGRSFLVAVYQLRCLGVTAPAIRLARADDDRLEIAWGDAPRTLGPGGTADLAQSDRSLRVRQKPLWSSAVEFVDGKPPANPVELVPGDNHGEIRFRTVVSARFHGKLPAAPGPSQESSP